MTAKTVSPPGLLGDLGGDSLVWLLEGPALALCLAAIATSVLARILVRHF